MTFVDYSSKSFINTAWHVNCINNHDINWDNTRLSCYNTIVIKYVQYTLESIVQAVQ